MTRQDRLRAFEMRLDGMSWDAIGSAIGYDGKSVSADILACIKNAPRQPHIIFPALRECVVKNFGGSVRQLSDATGISRNTLYDVFTGKRLPSTATVNAILNTTGLSYEEAFRR